MFPCVHQAYVRSCWCKFRVHISSYTSEMCKRINQHICIRREKVRETESNSYTARQTLEDRLADLISKGIIHARIDSDKQVRGGRGGSGSSR